jgi:hypothetical protein
MKKVILVLSMLGLLSSAEAGMMNCQVPVYKSVPIYIQRWLKIYQDKSVGAKRRLLQVIKIVHFRHFQVLKESFLQDILPQNVEQLMTE